MITTKKLQNNLTFMHKEIKGSNIVDVRVVLRAGQAYDHKVGVPAGTAHFLEHIVHEKTEKYGSKEALQNVIATKGGLRNALTNVNEKMVFFATVLKDEYEAAADYVSQVVCHTILTPEATEKHRSIITQEYLSKVQDANVKCWLGFLELSYKDSGIEHMAIGDLESIEKISLNNLQTFYDKRFKAENSILSIYGDISLDKAVGLAEKYFLDMKTDIPFSEIINFDNELYPSIETRVDLLDKSFKHTEIKEVQAVVFFGGINRGRNWKDIYSFRVLMHILAGDTTSIIYKILRDEKHLLYGVSVKFWLLDSVGSHAIVLNLAPENIQESLNIILEEINKIANGHVDDSRISITKSRIKANDVFNLQTIQNQALDAAETKLLFSNISTRDEYLAKIEAVTKEEVIEAAKYLKNHMNLLSVCSNKKEEYTF